MTNAQHIVNVLLMETGEPDQDYDHALWDAIVADLAAKGIPGAHHKEFDKYQGVYLMVPPVSKFWVNEDGLDYMGDWINMVLVPDRDGDERIEVAVERQADGASYIADTTDLVDYCKRAMSKRAFDHSITKLFDKELGGPND